MNENAMIWAALALYAWIYMLLGKRLGRIWGVDGSRMTPAKEQGKGRSSVRMLAGDLLACDVPAVVCGIALREMERGFALAALALAVLVLGVQRYMVLFVSVRHGAASLADIAAEEIGSPMRGIVHLLTVAAAIPALAAIGYLLACMVLDLQPAFVLSASAEALYAFALLSMLYALVPAGIQAGELRSESDAGALSMGSVLIAGLLAVCAAAWAEKAMTLPAVRGLREMLCCVPCLFTMERLARLGGGALCALFQRKGLTRRKPFPYARSLACLLVLVLSGLLAYAGCMALLPAAAVCAAILAAVSWVSCGLWFARIGRRML